MRTAGELNYRITMALLHGPFPLKRTLRIICDDYIKDNGLSYAKINDVIGALIGASIEYTRRTDETDQDDVVADTVVTFYRDVAVPYEDKKIKENGDVYPNRSQG